MRWRIVLRSRVTVLDAEIPSAILTIGPRFRHESMPEEVAVLLPTNEGPKLLIDAVASGQTDCRDEVLGLFLANPFLNLATEGPRLAGAGVRWITNLPSVEQQDEEFTQQLSDVALDHGRELSCLAGFRAQEFKIAVVVAGAAGAAAAVEIEPDAMIVLPQVADFAAGFPSLRQRGAAVQAVADAARSAGWSGHVLGLGSVGEAEHERLWPETLDGLVCRPTLD